jgi:hypothetical protein
MKRNRSLSVIHEDECKYDGYESSFLLIPSNITMIFYNILYKLICTYDKMLDCLKGIEKDDI